MTGGRDPGQGAMPAWHRERFANLSEALDFLAGCLELGDPGTLLSELEEAPRTLNSLPDYRAYFDRYVFQPLRAIHLKMDLRALYRDREFPSEGLAFKLGGHMQELGCIHIDFIQDEQGWSLRDIWLCR